MVALLGTIGSSASLAQQTGKASPRQRTGERVRQSNPEIAALRAGAKAFVDAFNKGDAKAIAAMWTENAEYIDESGRRYQGRDEIAKAYADYFASNPKAKIRVNVDSLRLVSDNVAIEDGRAVSDPPPQAARGFGTYSATHVKVDGKWLMASVRDSWVEMPASMSSAVDLDWLVGTWVAEENGATIESVCRWVANDSFIERKYTTTQVDGTKVSGVQLIGWNPAGGHVQSWEFSPGGGHAMGTWYPQPDGWSAEMRGVTGDGVQTASVNHLRRLDDNAYVWQSVQRSANGQSLPDTDEVVLKRKSQSR